jgi:SAM-dependent MidA family methyltransferase
MDSNPDLCNVIASCINTSTKGHITFAQYMEMVLYHPQLGYYSNQAINIGKEGDFFTSVHLGVDFGEMLAVQFVQMWEILGKPERFLLVEMGAGQGFLAADILNYLRQNHEDLYSGLEYIIVEKSPAMREQQQRRLLGFAVVRWCNFEEIPSNSVVGCIFSSELIDAFPVHQFVVEDGKLCEVYVTLDPSSRESVQFLEIWGEVSTPQLDEYFQLVGLDINNYPDQYRSEVNLAALEWLSEVENRLQRGYVLTIDYGYPNSRYYNPRRSEGTLQCYYQHQRHDNPYILVGYQDITTHVDFTGLERWGERIGLGTVGFTQQGLFLMALGLGDRIASLSYSKIPVPDMLRRRDSLQQLLDPLGLGNFGVLIQCKGLSGKEAAQPLKGLVQPE